MQPAQSLLLSSSQHCYHPCTQKHSQPLKPHTFISLQKIQSQLAEIQTKDGSQWFKFEENITVRLREFINDLEEYHDWLEKQFYKYKTVVAMNSDKLAQSDQVVLAEAMDKIVSAKVAKLTCHEVSQVAKSIALSNSNKKLQLNEQFKKVEEKIGEDLLERFYYRFSNVPKRIVEKSLNAEEMEKRMKMILQEEFVKMKVKMETANNLLGNSANSNTNKNVSPLITEEPKKQSNPIKQQKASDYFEQDPRKIIKKPLQTQSQKPIHSEDESKPISKTQLITQKIPTIPIDQITKTNTRFNVVVKVLFIDEGKIILGKDCVNFLAGDESGCASIVLEQSELVKKGNVISIKNCRVYNFKGSKQIQFCDDTEIELSTQPINNIGAYYLSRYSQHLFNSNVGTIDRVIGRSEGNSSKQTSSAPNEDNYRRYPNRQNEQRETGKRQQRRQPGTGRRQNKRHYYRGNNQRRGNQGRDQQKEGARRRDDRQRRDLPQRRDDRQRRDLPQRQGYQRRDQQRERAQRHTQRGGERRYRDQGSQLGRQGGQRGNQRRRGPQRYDDQKPQQRNQKFDRRSDRRQRPKQQQESFRQYEDEKQLQRERHRKRVEQLQRKNEQNLQGGQRQNETSSRGQRPQPQNNNPPATPALTKISDIEPQLQSIWVTGQVMKITSSTPRRTIFVFGDQTGVVTCQVPPSSVDMIEVGSVLQLRDFDVVVEKKNVLLRPTQEAKIVRLNKGFRVGICEENDVSAVEYEEVEEEEEEEEEDQKNSKTGANQREGSVECSDEDEQERKVDRKQDQRRDHEANRGGRVVRDRQTQKRQTTNTNTNARVERTIRNRRFEYQPDQDY